MKQLTPARLKAMREEAQLGLLFPIRDDDIYDPGNMKYSSEQPPRQFEQKYGMSGLSQQYVMPRLGGDDHTNEDIRVYVDKRLHYDLVILNELRREWRKQKAAIPASEAAEYQRLTEEARILARAVIAANESLSAIDFNALATRRSGKQHPDASSDPLGEWQFYLTEALADTARGAASGFTIDDITEYLKRKTQPYQKVDEHHNNKEAVAKRYNLNIDWSPSTATLTSIIKQAQAKEGGAPGIVNYVSGPSDDTLRRR